MNIIFDLGGVTFTWNQHLFLSHNFKDSNEYNTAAKCILNTSLWEKLDKGTASTEEIIKKGSEQSELPYKNVKKMVESIPEILQPISETIDIIKLLKSKGHKLFVLSNMGLDAAKKLEKKYHFWDLFDGITFSSRVNMIKPDTEIFMHVIEKYGLDIKNTVFIDDTYENILAATKLGIKVIHFDSAENCRKELTKLGCL
ncbi:MAG: HAD family phosphatase [Victivallales bacterium]|nr:HAD family phosphatase [Victivallales bacterium]